MSDRITSPVLPGVPITALLPVLLLAACGLLLAACGQKGDLYLPESQQESQQDSQVGRSDG